MTPPSKRPILPFSRWSHGLASDTDVLWGSSRVPTRGANPNERLRGRLHRHASSSELVEKVEVAGGYLAAKRRGKLPPLATDTYVNNCFSIRTHVLKQWDN